MTRARMTRHGFTISGHANYAPHGSDIVCAAISTLVFTFLRCVTPSDVIIENGFVKCTFPQLEGNDFIYYDSLITGLEMIAASYPDHLVVIRE